MNVISLLLIAIAIAFSFLTILMLFVWLREDGDAVFIPGFGLVVSTPALIVLLLVLNIVVVAAAALTKPQKEFIDTTVLRQKLERPK